MCQTITVGIPFHSTTNVLQFCEAVNSILNQTLIPDEIHLIQDGFIPDDLLETVNFYVRSISYVKHILLPQNLGLSHAINISVLSTTSKYYARMDSDDISFPERLEKQVLFLEDNPNIEILGAWAQEFKNNDNIGQGFIRKVPQVQSKMAELLHYRNPLIHPTVVFRRSVFAKIGLYDSNFRLEEDLELWSRAFKMNVGITNLSEVLLHYRFDGSGVNRRASAIKYQIYVRCNYRTYSLKLNLLKLMAIIMRTLPCSFQEWIYQKRRE